MIRTTAVAMSGGVDSSAAALLLQREGRALLGLTLHLFDGGEDGTDAAAAAAQMGFPHRTLDMSAAFRAGVIEPFAAEYEAGRTPNPCVGCNRAVKFGALLQAARALGCTGLATGHYARVEHDSGSGRWLLRKAARPEKDQSYVLAMLTQDQLSQALFPLGGLSKEEVRAIARQAGLTSARKKDSQDICFIPDGDYGAFLRRHTGKDYPAGPFLDEEGQVLGRHTGIVDYTVGQRRGLGVSSSRGRLYVKEIRPEEGAVVLSGGGGLFARTLTADRLNLIPCGRLEGPVRLRAKIRYRMAEQPCTAEQTGEESLRLTFDSPQRAICPGQTVVLYDGDTVVGGARILDSLDER
ncbi:tRNA 2-thiouridine(34) synthase MnmA [bacterium 1xD42-67]|nr:tRNA 2-thiouridine(34) synthase MnmA [bacterium 1xD42-67]